MENLKFSISGGRLSVHAAYRCNKNWLEPSVNSLRTMDCEENPIKEKKKYD